MTQTVLGVLIVGATAFSLLRAQHVPAAPLRHSSRRWRSNPGVWLLGVTALLFVNQVLFTVYVVRVHQGDTEFISRYLPPGWFDLADLGQIPQWFPAPEMLSWSLFRVSSFLELPFTLLAFLTVCRWLDAGVYRRVVRLIWPASVVFTATFCLIERSLSNPFTTQDIVIRIVSGVAVPLLVSRFARDSEHRVRSLPDLVVFIVSAGALGYLVLAIYDTALLYSLGRVPDDAAGSAAAIVLMALARWQSRHVNANPAGPRTTALINSLEWFAVVFFVPALAIRYGLNFGLPLLSAVAGLAVALAAVFLGVGRAGRALVPGLVVSAGVGIAAGGLIYFFTNGYTEARLFLGGGVFLVAVVAVCAVADRRENRLGTSSKTSTSE